MDVLDKEALHRDFKLFKITRNDWYGEDDI